MEKHVARKGKKERERENEKKFEGIEMVRENSW